MQNLIRQAKGLQYFTRTNFKKHNVFIFIMLTLWVLLSIIPLAAQTKIAKVSNRGETPSVERSRTIKTAGNTTESTPIEYGYKDHSYGNNATDAPTGEKPESKLWFNDGIWWASMFDPGPEKYYIYRFDAASQSFTSTGTEIDDRGGSKADALWDGNKLYIASHIWSDRSGNGNEANSSRLYRYSYNPGTKQYTLDAGFPVIINSSTCESLVIEKDSSGQLWITWMQNGKVMINRTLGDDLSWGDPYQLPSQQSNGKSDDLCSIQAFGGNKVGILWSDQNDMKLYFSYHNDSSGDMDWETRETAISGNNLADDHISLKMGCDGQGNVYSVSKTSASGNDPGILLAKRTISGSWSKSEVAADSDNWTRPILVVDIGNELIYVFAKGKVSSKDAIYYKTTSLNGNLSFEDGIGTPFIKDNQYVDINNPTSTKQCITSASGLLILASDKSDHIYFHNYIEGEENNSPAIFSFSPSVGQEGTPVTINGSNFSGATSVKFNGTSADFDVISNNKIETSVPAGASTGPISVTTGEGTGTSASDFTVSSGITYTLTVTEDGNGSVSLDPAGGVYEEDQDVELTANPADGWAFSHWEGDLIGSNNPVIITMDEDKQITAVFTELPPNQYVLTTNVNGNGAVNVDPAGGIYDEGTEVTLTADADPGYFFIGWTGDLIGTENPVTITMDANKTITANFIEEGSGGGQVVFRESQSGGSSGANTLSTANNVTAVAGDLYIAAVAAKRHTTVSGITGLGLSWTRIDVQCGGRNQTGVDVWRAMGAPSGDGPVTATLDGAPSNASIIVTRYSGVDPVAPIGATVSANTNGENGSCDGGADGRAYQFNLVATASGSVVYAAAARRHRPHNPGEGFTERVEYQQGSGGSAAGLAVQDKNIVIPGPVNVSGSFGGSVDWAVASFEIRPGGDGGGTQQYLLTVNTVGSGNVLFDPPTNGSGGLYDEGTIVELTANPDAGWEFSHWEGDLGGSENPESVTMDGNKTVTAVFTELPADQFSLTIDFVGLGTVELDPAPIGKTFGGVYDAGTEVAITPVPADGWTFTSWGGDASGSDTPLTITMDSNKNITVFFAEIGGNSGEVVYEETQTGGSSGALNVSTATPVTMLPGNFYIAAISTKRQTEVTAVSGLGLNWTEVKSQCSGRTQTGVSVWVGEGTPSGDGIVTAMLATEPQNAIIAVSRYSGVDLSNPIGTVGSGNTNGANGACSGGTDNGGYSSSMTITSNGAMFYAAIARRHKEHTPSSEFTERIDQGQGDGGSVAGIVVQDQSITTAASVPISGSFRGKVDWAIVGLEIRPASAAIASAADQEYEIIRVSGLSERALTTAMPQAFSLSPNYPNPFNGETTIEYALPQSAFVRLTIYNVLGQQVRVLANEAQEAGYQTLTWNGKNDFGVEVASGVYLLRFSAGENTFVRRMIYQK